MYCYVVCFIEIIDEKSMWIIIVNKGLWINFCLFFFIFIKFWMVLFKKLNVNKIVYFLIENVYYFDFRLFIIFWKLFFFLKNFIKMG